MNKAVVVLGICVITSILVSGIPRAVESATPISETLRADVRSYNESVTGSGSLSFPDRHEVTSALPLVLDKFFVSPGDTVNVGDTIATVDRKSSAALIESLGQVKSLAIPAASLSTAIALIPDSVTADCSGRVISTALAGSAVQSGGSIATIAGSGSLIVTAAVSELDIAKIEIGQRASFSPAAYPDEEFLGTVTGIAEAARSQYNGAVLETVVDITVTPDKDDPRLKHGLSADVEVMLSEPREVLVLPYSAIAQDDNGEYVFVYEDQRAARRNIVTGAEFADGTEIKSGITAEDIIFQTPEELSDRSFIRISQQSDDQTKEHQ